MDAIIKEVCQPDFRFYFDCACYSPEAGGFEYTVFPIYSDCRGYYCNHYSTINEKEYKDIEQEMMAIIEEIDTIINSYSNYKNVKEIMSDYKIPYNSHKAHELKKLIDIDDFVDQFTLYLSIKTGKKWESKGVYGYCQGDYIEVVYCSDIYTEKDAERIGEFSLGCGKEFSITWIENGKEADTVYGYYVADCEAWRDEEIKKIVCGYEGLNPEKVTLQMIDNVSMVYHPNYRTV